MPKLSIAVGLGLIIVGIAGYLYVSAASETALIPAFIGIVFVIVGAVGLKPGARKHAMHVAAALALLTVLASIMDFASLGTVGSLFLLPCQPGFESYEGHPDSKSRPLD